MGRACAIHGASVEDSKKVVEICTQYAQAGMFNIFLSVFFGTLAFAFLEPFFFIGYLIGIAFLAGTLVLTDTLGATFDDLFNEVNAGIDVEVRSADEIGQLTHSFNVMLARVTDLAAHYDMSLNSVSKHIKVLEAAGLTVPPIVSELTRPSLNSIAPARS